MALTRYVIMHVLVCRMRTLANHSATMGLLVAQAGTVYARQDLSSDSSGCRGPARQLNAQPAKLIQE